MNMQLSKSEYMMFLKHPAWVWLKKHDKGKLPPVSDALQALFDEGHLFEEFAEQLWPDGVRVGFSDYDSYLSLPKRTKEALDGGAEVVFQGRFEHEQLTCIVDVLKRVDNTTFDLIEIKSSTRAKEEHEFDLAFQVLVLEGCGFTIRKVSVVHVNNQYVREGDVNVAGLTKESDITEKVRGRIDFTKKYAGKAVEVMESGKMPNPSPRYARLGSYGDWLEVYENVVGEFTEDSIYQLAWAGAEKIEKLEELDIERIGDIPDDFELTVTQARQREAVIAGEPLVEAKEISNFLDGLVYPLLFLDYETFGGVIPAFDGIRPYQQVPFQYSLHVIDEEGAGLRHLDFLHPEASHPGEAFAQSLVEDVGEVGSVIVWNEAFEKKVNRELAEAVPELAEMILGINDRVIDLMVPFKAGWYADAGFGGSASIKNVLPVLNPELSYKGLNIADGMTASRTWTELIIRGQRQDELDQVLLDLIEYCRLDTLAMVEIWRMLVEVSSRDSKK